MRGFESIVDEHFDFLCHEHKFSRAAEDDRVSYRRDDLKISVWRNRGMVGVTVSKGGPPTIRTTDTYFTFDLACFAYDRDGDKQTYHTRQFSSDMELTEHLEEQIAGAANALRVYGTAVIQGRFDDWKGLRQRMREAHYPRR